jgi:3'-phosphoadenosine 5'-phosphosulfate sulfotransferase (PAPS reductase)/FAD synthetase
VQIVSAEYPQELFDKRNAAVLKGWAKKQKVMAGTYRGVIMPSLTRTDTKFAEAWRGAAKDLGWGEFDSPIDAFNDAFIRSGNPFLDMCLLHGGFPLGRQRFCTDELKMQVVFDKVLAPLIEQGENVIQWSGVRADESDKRATYKTFESDLRDETGSLFNFLPIHSWTAQDVFSLYKHFGVKPNPLYKEGMGRVGCMPCVLVNKEELAEIAARFPAEIERVADWELQVAKVSRWVHWMIAGHVNRRQFKSLQSKRNKMFYKDPQNKVKALLSIRNAPGHFDYIAKNLERTFKKEQVSTFRFGSRVSYPRDYRLDAEAYKGSAMLGPRGNVIGGSIYDAIDWAKTGRGGNTYDLVTASIDKEVCSSKYGLCG